MKVFKYDPKTGKRGEQIDNIQRPSWGGCSADYLVRTGKMKDMGWITGNFGPGAQATIHEDAGGSDREGKSVSYRRDEWICFCTGEWKTGDDTSWVWTILPSEQDYQAAQI